MPDDQTIEQLAKHALDRNKRSIDLLTTFLMESAAMVLVFGILDDKFYQSEVRPLHCKGRNEEGQPNNCDNLDYGRC
jgi:hypothetical protein